MSRFPLRSTAKVLERAILVGVDMPSSEWPIDASLDELERLAATDNAEVVARITQRLDHPIPKTFIGRGKTDELVLMAKELKADVVIFDDELSPSQQHNLEKALGEPIKVIDRTALILDIFGAHATTREGRLQVRLAQLQYLLPRLRGMWSHLIGEQTRGGIGSRFGQGESQLEVDRRLVRNRISALKRELSQLEGRREVQSKARWESGTYRVALAGYTNAGKSTLLNALTKADVYSKDELFATLDPTTRALSLQDGRNITLTDTVGFIQKLPTTLVESFKSTLAEVHKADLILRVIDASDEAHLRHMRVVDEILVQIEAQDIPSLIVFNKSDLLEEDDYRDLHAAYPSAIFISAEKGRGLDELLFRIANEASRGDQVISVLIPYDQGMLIKLVHERCQIISERYEQEGLLATLKASARFVDTLAQYRIDIECED